MNSFADSLREAGIAQREAHVAATTSGLVPLADEQDAFISTVPAGRRDRALAFAVVAVSAALFLAAIPLAKEPLGQVWAFIPAYQSALVVCDLITAALLFGQVHFSRSAPLYVLAVAYLFTAVMALTHALSFPGLFAPGGLLGAGPQSTAWLYMFWHAGFPALVIAYAVLKRSAPVLRRSITLSTIAGIAAACAAAAVLTWLATGGAALLPPIMHGNRYTPAMIFVVSSVWLLSLVALLVLWRQRAHTLLELWLMVVLCAWLFDIGLAAVFNAGRFDLGFYAGRVYGLAAAMFVLLVLLLENGALHGRLAAAYRSDRERAAALAAANRELDSFSYSVSHDLRSPLRAVDGYARMLEEDYAERLDAEGRRLLGVVRDSSRRMGHLIDDLLAFSRLGRQQPALHRFDMEALARETLAQLPLGRATLEVGALPPAQADRSLMKQVWLNLIGNAVKYSGKRAAPRIEVGGRQEARECVYWVRDNGAGFDMRYASKLFGVFQRLHAEEEFPGTGVGLAIVQRIVTRHGGRVWAEAAPDAGACFYFALPRESL